MRETSQTPSLPEVIQTYIDAALVDVNVCMPAEVVAYDGKTQKAQVQPCLLRKYESGALVRLPVIPNVPVIHPRTSGSFIHLPLQKGDTVTLIVSQRSLDNWKTKGGAVDPADRRKFNISDAYAIPGGYADPQAFTPETTDAIEIVNGSAKIIVEPSGKFQIKNGSAELLDQISQAISTLATASTLAGGPFVPTVVAELQQIATAIQGLKG